MIQSFDYFGIRVTKMGADEFVGTIDQSLAREEPTTASYLHFHTVNLVLSDPEAAEAFRSLDLLTPDGVAVLSTSGLFGPRLTRENILVMEYALPHLAPVAIRNGWSFFLLGGAPGVAERAADHLQARFPGIKIAGTHHGYITSDEDSEQVLEAISESRPTILLVGMGQPKQEKWVARYKSRLRARFVLCVGGFIEKLSKRETVYPAWVYRFHLYWMYRMVTEPRRVWKRYTFGGLRFGGHLLRHAIRRRSARSADPLAPGTDGTRSKRLRMLFLNHNVVRGGGTFFRAFDVARYLVGRGHSVTLLSISPQSRFRREREVVAGVEIIHTPDFFWGMGRSGWDLWDALSRVQFVSGRRWDLIQAWDTRPVVILPALAARFFSRKRNAKLIIDWSDWWGRGGTQMERGGSWMRYFYNAIETFFEERFRRFADGTTVISTSLRARAVGLGVPREEILLLPQGCDLIPLGTAASREEARRTLGIAPDEHLFITVGVLNVSDAKLLFEVIRRGVREIPRARFVLIGRNRVKTPGDILGPRVQDAGFVPADVLAGYMAAADAFVVPLSENLSSRARWPSRINVALAHGLPVVVTRVGDLPLLLDHEGAAFVARPDAEDIVRKLAEVVSDKAAAERVRIAARRVATELLAWPLVVDQLEEFYSAVFARDESPVAAGRQAPEKFGIQ